MQKNILSTLPKEDRITGSHLIAPVLSSQETGHNKF